MKHILLIMGLGIIAIGHVAAQDVSYWVGKSSNPDPIMRHHEAFMDAFIKYIQNHEIVGVVSTETTGSTEKSSGNESNKSIGYEICRVETVSSVTHEGCETITISIGSGALVTYTSFGESSSNGDTMQTRAILEIAYQEEADRMATQSVHRYNRESFTDKITDTSINQFSYECSFTSKHE